MKKVFITGGTGLVGNHVARKFLSEGWNVSVLTRRPNQAKTILPQEKVSFIKGDITDIASLQACLGGHDVLVHSAGIHAQWMAKKDEDYIKVNVEGTRALLAAAERAGIKKVIYTSSIKTIGTNPLLTVQNEEVQYDFSKVDSPYGLSKALAEQAVLQYPGNINIKVLNPAGIIGKYDTAPSPIGYLIKKTILEKIHFFLDLPISLVDARDVADAHYAALESGGERQRYILAAPPILMKDFIQHIDDLIKYRRPMVCVPTFLIPPAAHILDFVSSISKVRFIFNRKSYHTIIEKKVYDGSKAEGVFNFHYRNIFDSLTDALQWVMGECPG